MNQASEKIDWLYVSLIAIVLFLWSSAYVAIRMALKVYSAENLAFLRYFVGSVGFIIITSFFKIRAPLKKDIPALFIMGLLGTAMYSLLLNYGQRTVNAGLASIIISANPFFVMLIAIALKQEKAKAVHWIGMVIAFVGVVIIVARKTTGASIDFDVLSILGAAICMAIFLVLQKRHVARYTPLEITCYSLWSGTIVLYFFSDKPFTFSEDGDMRSMMCVIYLGIFPGMLAYLLMGYILKKYRASNASSFLFLVPFITVLLGWVMLGEIPGISAAAGGLLIVMGILLKNAK